MQSYSRRCRPKCIVKKKRKKEGETIWPGVLTIPPFLMRTYISGANQCKERSVIGNREYLAFAKHPSPGCKVTGHGYDFPDVGRISLQFAMGTFFVQFRRRLRGEIMPSRLMM